MTCSSHAPSRTNVLGSAVKAAWPPSMMPRPLRGSLSSTKYEHEIASAAISDAQPALPMLHLPTSRLSSCTGSPPHALTTSRIPAGLRGKADNDDNKKEADFGPLSLLPRASGRS